MKYRKVSSSIVARYRCIRSCCITCRSVAVYRTVRSGPVLSQCQVLVRPVSSQCNVASCGARSCRSVSNVPSRCVSSHCLALFGRVARYSFARISHVQSHCQVGQYLVSSRPVAMASQIAYSLVALSSIVKSSLVALYRGVLYRRVSSHCPVMFGGIASRHVQSHCLVLTMRSCPVALSSRVRFCRIVR